LREQQADQGKVDGGKRMKVESIVLGSIGTNCYIVTNEETKECFAVDMAECPQEYVNYIKNNGLEMKALFLTHGHFDHIMGIDDFLKAFPVPVYAKTNFL
jgi:hydroxyacylglutathione hydrolase